jgi:hypothetical protein
MGSAEIWLQFRTDASTVNSLLPETLKPRSAETLGPLSPYQDRLAGWVRLEPSKSKGYFFRSVDPKNNPSRTGFPGFYSQTAILIYDPAQGLVQYHWFGND